MSKDTTTILKEAKRRLHAAYELILIGYDNLDPEKLEDYETTDPVEEAVQNEEKPFHLLSHDEQVEEIEKVIKASEECDTQWVKENLSSIAAGTPAPSLRTQTNPAILAGLEQRVRHAFNLVENLESLENVVDFQNTCTTNFVEALLDKTWEQTGRKTRAARLLQDYLRYNELPEEIPGELPDGKI